MKRLPICPSSHDQIKFDIVPLYCSKLIWMNFFDGAGDTTTSSRGVSIAPRENHFSGKRAVSDASSNDNITLPADATPTDPDARGQAAMLLVESLIHALVARSVIGLSDAVEIIAIAADTQRQMDDETRHASDPTASSLTLLEAIGSSLANDLPC
ncbi:hypothetical protein [Sphingomonas sp. PB4P5]|uniref:hypothetical protein n=1 Tax=Parasphingomonas puruogangriensis TaxID=3096155 RepID=UPI002FC5E816